MIINVQRKVRSSRIARPEGEVLTIGLRATLGRFNEFDMLLQFMYTILVFGQILICLLLVAKKLCKIKTYAFLSLYIYIYIYLFVRKYIRLIVYALQTTCFFFSTLT